MLDLDMLKSPLGAVVLIIAIQAAFKAAGSDVLTGY